MESALGAGNGMMGEELVDVGVESIVGVDVIEEAAKAAERDRPETYDEYYVLDMTKLDEDERATLATHQFNALTCVAALGFGDIPPEVFTTAYNLVKPDGWITFNIKEKFLNDRDATGFSNLIHTLVDAGAMNIRRQKKYPHRLGTDRKPLHYVAVVGRKDRDVSVD